MGPALLPTPLSPARGRFDFSRLPANLPSRFHDAHLAPDVSSFRTEARPGLSPALAPASSYRLTGQSKLAGPKPFDPGVCSLGGAVAASHMDWQPSRVCFGPKPSTFAVTGPIRGRNDDLASHSPQTIRLAFGRNLIHAFSRTARGQKPPYLWNSKLHKIRALRLAFLMLRVPKTG